MQWDAAQRGGVEVSVAAVKTTSLKIYHSQLFISITLHQHIADVIVTFLQTTERYGIVNTAACFLLKMKSLFIKPYKNRA